jgi:type I site-specific restriction endonuclease
VLTVPQFPQDDIMKLVDYVDITSGLTRKQTMKRRAEGILSPNPILNELLNNQLQKERQLKMMMEELKLIDALLSNEITDESLEDFENNHSDIVPELHQKISEINLNSSIGTISSIGSSQVDLCAS